MESFEKINQAIRNREVLPCLAETVFTLEGVKRLDRRTFLAFYRPDIRFFTEALPDGTIGISMTIAPDLAHHPGNNPYLSSHLEDALALGFKLLHCPRIGCVRNPDILDSYFLPDNHVPIGGRQQTFAECIVEIERHGCGIQHIKEIGRKYANSSGSWQDGMKNAPSSEDEKIAAACAEWADGDAIAAHIAYRNDYFCTRDIGKRGGEPSILAPGNRRWLQSHFEIDFVAPEELANKLQCETRGGP